MAIVALAEHLVRTQSVQQMVCAILIRSVSTQAVVAKQLEMSDTTLGQLRIGKRIETKGQVLKRIMVAVLDIYKSVEDYEQTLAMYTGEHGLQAWAEGYLSSERQRKPKTKPAAQPKFAWLDQPTVGSGDDDIEVEDDDVILSIDNMRQASPPPPKVERTMYLLTEDDEDDEEVDINLSASTDNKPFGDTIPKQRPAWRPNPGYLLGPDD